MGDGGLEYAIATHTHTHTSWYYKYCAVPTHDRYGSTAYHYPIHAADGSIKVEDGDPIQPSTKEQDREPSRAAATLPVGELAQALPVCLSVPDAALHTRKNALWGISSKNANTR